MFRLIKSQASFKSSVSLSLQSQNARFSSNYYGPLNQFKLSDKDLKIPTPVQVLIDKYRKYGHHYSHLDPLGLVEKYISK